MAQLRKTLVLLSIYYFRVLYVLCVIFVATQSTCRKKYENQHRLPNSCNNLNVITDIKVSI